MSDSLEGFPESICETSSPLIEAVSDPSHRCHNCPMANAAADKLDYLLDLRARNTDVAVEFHEDITRGITEAIQHSYGPQGKDLEQSVGKQSRRTYERLAR